jgi:ankyrin repeat protein
MTVAQALADVNGRNASSQTPLNRAARKGNVDVAHFLIELGAEVASRNCASRSGLLEVSRALLDHGANANARKQTTGLQCISQHATDIWRLRSCCLDVARMYMR